MMAILKHYYKVKEYDKGILKTIKSNVITNENKKITLEILNKKHYNKCKIYKTIKLN